MGNTTAILLAGPERRRILRELLNRSDPPEAWPRILRLRYIDALSQEHAAWKFHRPFDDVWYEQMEQADEEALFAHLFAVSGVPREKALTQARAMAAERTAKERKERSRAESERRRRRTRRDAVTGMRGAEAVTTGLLTECVVCGSTIRRNPKSWRRRRRSDKAYCSDACKQKAYRHRMEATTA